MAAVASGCPFPRPGSPCSASEAQNRLHGQGRKPLGHGSN